MSEAMPASREYRRTFAFAKNKSAAYVECWAPNPDIDCCVECNAPEDVVAEFLAVRRLMTSMLEALQDHCGYDYEDMLALDKKYEEEFYIPVLQAQAEIDRYGIYFQYDMITRARHLAAESE